MNFLQYHINPEIEAFSTGKDTVLPYYVVQPHQVHGDNIAIVIDRNTTRGQLEGIDALITNQCDCAIAVRTADCVPILMFDPDRKVIAAVHSGWRGTVKGIVQKVINKMKEEFGTQSEAILAVIGPSIGPESFSVHEDVRDAFQHAMFPMNDICKPKEIGSFLIDLWKANKWLLEQAGVNPNNIQFSGICTYIHHEEFYSARYEKDNKCGRNINVIKLKG